MISIDSNLKCLRNIEGNMPLEQITSDEEPITFVCAGISSSTTRKYEEDKYCHCFKSVDTDTTFYLSETDVKDILCVLSRAMCVGNYIEEE